MPGSYIVAGARTPIGKLSGALSSFSAMDLGGIAIAAAVERAGVQPDQVDHVLMGLVIQAGNGQVPARQAAVKAGIPLSVPANTLNKACLSGINAIYLADQMIATGEADVVVAGGMESMTNAPYLVPQGRAGYRYGDGQFLDAINHDGLMCALEQIIMGGSTERYAQAAGLTREAQDELAALSHERASEAIKAGRFDDEITDVRIPQRKGEPIVVNTDEGVRPGTTSESLSKLKPAFDPNGNITAGNASQLSDGACAVVVMSKEKADELGVTPLGEIVGYGMVSGPDTPSLLSQPANAIRKALSRAKLELGQLDLFELNEAFAAVGLQSMKDLGINGDVTNVNGGAIALGHPIGMSGARIALTLLHELKRRGGGMGAAALCGGGGQGDAVLLRTV